MSLYIKRSYRNKVLDTGLLNYEVKIKESDLFISTNGDFSKQAKVVLENTRTIIENHISKQPEFKDSLKPLGTNEEFPPLINQMIKAGQKANVGPMAAIAGAVSQEVGRDLLQYSDEVIVENGGDIFIKIKQERKIAIFAGESSLNMKVGLILKPQKEPLGICTSSGTVGHSLSHGNADAVVCVSDNAVLSDAYATAIGNMIINQDDIETGLKYADTQKELSGCVIIVKDKIGAIGNIELCKIT
jgi:ApbE superfamily uncharacterized protein (UPF0280 family)